MQREHWYLFALSNIRRKTVSLTGNQDLTLPLLFVLPYATVIIKNKGTVCATATITLKQEEMHNQSQMLPIPSNQTVRRWSIAYVSIFPLLQFSGSRSINFIRLENLSLSGDPVNSTWPEASRRYSYSLLTSVNVKLGVMINTNGNGAVAHNISLAGGPKICACPSKKRFWFVLAVY